MCCTIMYSTFVCGYQVPFEQNEGMAGGTVRTVKHHSTTR